MPNDERRRSQVTRFNRIAGQVGGIARMIDDGRYCIDILQQVQAVRAALNRAEAEVLRDHAASCVATAIASGDPSQQQEKIDELIALFDRSNRT
jgi:CsoR family transcriptional regulator, copper-sensing transcriptional repressor